MPIKNVWKHELSVSCDFRSSIQVHKYHYVEREPQTTQASMCHTMMLQQHYPNLLSTLVI
jgi:hypothetical protein